MCNVVRTTMTSTGSHVFHEMETSSTLGAAHRGRGPEQRDQIGSNIVCRTVIIQSLRWTQQTSRNWHPRPTRVILALFKLILVKLSISDYQGCWSSDQDVAVLCELPIKVWEWSHLSFPHPHPRLALWGGWFSSVSPTINHSQGFEPKKPKF